jgi:hypothetical protein
VARLEQHINEAQWRLQLITRRPTTPRARPGGAPTPHHPLQDATAATASPAVSIIERMLASPNTLLTACLKANDFNGVRLSALALSKSICSCEFVFWRLPEGVRMVCPTVRVGNVALRLVASELVLALPHSHTSTSTPAPT